MTLHPVTIEAVQQILSEELLDCNQDQLEVFRRYKSSLYFAPITRYSQLEHVVVVARKDAEVIYWEDVEEGFNVSPIAIDGTILEHSCNQDRLGLALNSWIEKRNEL